MVNPEEYCLLDFKNNLFGIRAKKDPWTYKEKKSGWCQTSWQQNYMSEDNVTITTKFFKK